MCFYSMLFDVSIVAAFVCSILLKLLIASSFSPDYIVKFLFRLCRTILSDLYTGY